MWGTDYKYEIKLFGNGLSNLAFSNFIHTGSIKCRELYRTPFCISGDAQNKYICNSRNEVEELASSSFASQFCRGEECVCAEDEYCMNVFESGSLKAKCVQGDDCSTFDVNYNGSFFGETNLFGMFSFNNNSGNTCTHDNGERKYCYNDYANYDQNYLSYYPTDSCGSCRNVDSCLSYKSEYACNANECAVPDLSGAITKCRWEPDPLTKDLGDGICVSDGEEKRECGLCDSLSSISGCNDFICSSLGDCGFVRSDYNYGLNIDSCVDCDLMIQEGVGCTIFTEENCNGMNSCGIDACSWSESDVGLANYNYGGLIKLSPKEQPVCRKVSCDSIETKYNHLIRGSDLLSKFDFCERDLYAPFTKVNLVSKENVDQDFVPENDFLTTSSDLLFSINSQCPSTLDCDNDEDGARFKLFYCLSPYKEGCQDVDEFKQREFIYSKDIEIRINPFNNTNFNEISGDLYVKYFSEDQNFNKEKIKSSSYTYEINAPKITFENYGGLPYRLFSESVGGLSLETEYKVEGDVSGGCVQNFKGININREESPLLNFDPDTNSYTIYITNIVDGKYELKVLCSDGKGNYDSKKIRVRTDANSDIIYEDFKMELEDGSLMSIKEDGFFTDNINFNFLGFTQRTKYPSQSCIYEFYNPYSKEKVHETKMMAGSLREGFGLKSELIKSEELLSKDSSGIYEVRYICNMSEFNQDIVDEETFYLIVDGLAPIIKFTSGNQVVEKFRRDGNNLVNTQILSSSPTYGLDCEDVKQTIHYGGFPNKYYSTGNDEVFFNEIEFLMDGTTVDVHSIDLDIKEATNNCEYVMNVKDDSDKIIAKSYTLHSNKINSNSYTSFIFDNLKLESKSLTTFKFDIETEVSCQLKVKASGDRISYNLVPAEYITFPNNVNSSCNLKYKKENFEDYLEYFPGDKFSIEDEIIYVESVDQLGNKNSSSYSLLIDTKYPNITYIDYSELSFKEPARATLLLQAEDDFGIDRIEFKILKKTYLEGQDSEFYGSEVNLPRIAGNERKGNYSAQFDLTEGKTELIIYVHDLSGKTTQVIEYAYVDNYKPSLLTSKPLRIIKKSDGNEISFNPVKGSYQLEANEDYIFEVKAEDVNYSEIVDNVSIKLDLGEGYETNLEYQEGIYQGEIVHNLPFPFRNNADLILTLTDRSQNKFEKRYSLQIYDTTPPKLMSYDVLGCLENLNCIEKNYGYKLGEGLQTPQLNFDDEVLENFDYITYQSSTYDEENFLSSGNNVSYVLKLEDLDSDSLEIAEFGGIYGKFSNIKTSKVNLGYREDTKAPEIIEYVNPKEDSFTANTNIDFVLVGHEDSDSIVVEDKFTQKILYESYGRVANQPLLVLNEISAKYNKDKNIICIANEDITKEEELFIRNNQYYLTINTIPTIFDFSVAVTSDQCGLGVTFNLQIDDSVNIEDINLIKLYERTSTPGSIEFRLNELKHGKQELSINLIDDVNNQKIHDLIFYVDTQKPISSTIPYQGKTTNLDEGIRLIISDNYNINNVPSIDKASIKVEASNGNDNLQLNNLVFTTNEKSVETTIEKNTILELLNEVSCNNNVGAQEITLSVSGKDLANNEFSDTIDLFYTPCASDISYTLESRGRILEPTYEPYKLGPTIYSSEDSQMIIEYTDSANEYELLSISTNHAMSTQFEKISSNRYRVFLNNANDGIYTISLNSKLISSDKTFSYEIKLVQDTTSPDIINVIPNEIYVSDNENTSRMYFNLEGELENSLYEITLEESENVESSKINYKDSENYDLKESGVNLPIIVNTLNKEGYVEFNLVIEDKAKNVQEKTFRTNLIVDNFNPSVNAELFGEKISDRKSSNFINFSCGNCDDQNIFSSGCSENLYFNFMPLSKEEYLDSNLDNYLNELEVNKQKYNPSLSKNYRNIYKTSEEQYLALACFSEDNVGNIGYDIAKVHLDNKLPQIILEDSDNAFAWRDNEANQRYYVLGNINSANVKLTSDEELSSCVYGKVEGDYTNQLIKSQDNRFISSIQLLNNNTDIYLKCSDLLGNNKEIKIEIIRSSSQKPDFSLEMDPESISIKPASKEFYLISDSKNDDWLQCKYNFRLDGTTYQIPYVGNGFYLRNYILEGSNFAFKDLDSLIKDKKTYSVSVTCRNQYHLEETKSISFKTNFIQDNSTPVILTSKTPDSEIFLSSLITIEAESSVTLKESKLTIGQRSYDGFGRKEIYYEIDGLDSGIYNYVLSGTSVLGKEARIYEGVFRVDVSGPELLDVKYEKEVDEDFIIKTLSQDKDGFEVQDLNPEFTFIYDERLSPRGLDIIFLNEENGERVLASTQVISDTIIVSPLEELNAGTYSISALVRNTYGNYGTQEKFNFVINIPKYDIQIVEPSFGVTKDPLPLDLKFKTNRYSNCEWVFQEFVGFMDSSSILVPDKNHLSHEIKNYGAIGSASQNGFNRPIIVNCKDQSGTEFKEELFTITYDSKELEYNVSMNDVTTKTSYLNILSNKPAVCYYSMRNNDWVVFEGMNENFEQTYSEFPRQKFIVAENKNLSQNSLENGKYNDIKVYCLDKAERKVSKEKRVYVDINQKFSIKILKPKELFVDESSVDLEIRTNHEANCYVGILPSDNKQIMQSPNSLYHLEKLSGLEEGSNEIEISCNNPIKGTIVNKINIILDNTEPEILEIKLENQADKEMNIINTNNYVEFYASGYDEDSGLKAFNVSLFSTDNNTLLKTEIYDDIKVSSLTTKDLAKCLDDANEDSLDFDDCYIEFLISSSDESDIEDCLEDYEDSNLTSTNIKSCVKDINLTIDKIYSINEKLSYDFEEDVVYQLSVRSINRVDLVSESIDSEEFTVDVSATTSEEQCRDGIQNGLETDSDCGGVCGKCDFGDDCALDEDCDSGKCGLSGVCVSDKCSNLQLDLTETDVDCGGTCVIEFKRCELGKVCLINDDCESSSCDNGTCGENLKD
ncbi:hypothetical protein KY321_01110 [Candidatus Woesearchaeota archaeon]|nr:hypothetical protein [Candidatus Woesearchaeota archaeon]